MSRDITVLAPNGRRQTIKCSLNTTILQVLEDVCEKQGYDPSEYDLKHHNKVMDLSNTVRFANLPNKASLEMVEAEHKRQDSIVTIGLQLANDERRFGEFSPQTSLYEVLEGLARAELEACLHPTVVYTRREVHGALDLRRTNLRHLGLTGGRAILRLIDKSPEELKTQANVSSVLLHRPTSADEPIASTSRAAGAPGTSRSADSEPSPGPSDVRPHTPTAHGINPIKLIKEEMKRAANINAIDETEELETPDKARTDDICVPERSSTVSMSRSDITPERRLEQEQWEEMQLQRRLNIEQEVTFLGEYKAIAFVPSSSGEGAELADLPDDFYELTVEEVRKLYRELRQHTAAAVDAPLLTAGLRAATRLPTTEEMQSTHPHTVVRVQFPDCVVLQGVFAPTDTVETVHRFVAQYLLEPHRPFNLFTTPTRETLNPELSLAEAKFVPCVLLHFRWADQGSVCEPFLKEHVYSNQTSSEAAAMLASKYRAPVRRKLEDSAPAQSRGQSTSGSASSKDSKLPKWFKLRS